MLAEIQKTQNQLSNEVSAEEAAGSISLLDLAEILDQHKMWVESGGESGVKADLCGVNLSHSDLTGVNLEGAFIQRATLIGADLSMANLRGASLVQADLREALEPIIQLFRRKSSQRGEFSLNGSALDGKFEIVVDDFTQQAGKESQRQALQRNYVVRG